ncbi:hypothetical protein BH10PSE19_BH10PSE19_00450 [soil metagenome]
MFNVFKIYIAVTSIMLGMLINSETTAAVNNMHPRLYANFALKSNNPNQTYTAIITLYNNSAQPINHWQLGLNSIRAITKIKEATITQQIGKYFLLTPLAASIQTIPPKGSVVLHITGKGHLKSDSDIAVGYFLVATPSANHAVSTQPISVKTQLLSSNKTTAGATYARNVAQQHTAIEGNPIASTMTLQQSLIVPLPVSLKLAAGNFKLQADTKILLQDAKALSAAKFFSESIHKATGYHLELITKPVTVSNVIVFRQQAVMLKDAQEAYKLTVAPEKIVINANTAAGYFYAIQSLRQLLPAIVFAQNKQNGPWIIPALEIIDYPRFTYRGLMLDSARHFMPIERIKRLLDLMAMHKLNVFHWHLTDDEGWRIEIKRYPALTAVGAWRGFGLAIPPSLGTGPKRYGGYYSQQEIRELIDYAATRHITIIPEIEMPGHARALIVSLPEKLLDKNDKSHYSSVQDYQDNVLSPCIESTYTVLGSILTEVSHLFPSKVIHIGADEVPTGIWMQSPSCQALMKKLDLQNTKQLQHYFLTRIQKILQANNKIMGGWEEIIGGGELHHSAWIYHWAEAKKALKTTQRGYDVILMPAEHLYFDLAYNKDAKEPGLYWAGYIDTFKAYSYQPIPTNMPVALAKKIRGVQGALWSEYLISDERLDYMAFPRVAALAELAWTPAARRNWHNFSERLGTLHLPRLDNYGVLYRIPLPGINPEKFLQGLLEANVEFPGLFMRYTKDGSIPSGESTLYKDPIKITPVSLLKMKTFTGEERSSLTQVMHK